MNLRPFILAVFCCILLSPLQGIAETEDPLPAGGDQPSPSDQYRRALAVDPENPTLHYFLGVTLLTENRDLEAIGEFRQAYPAYIGSAEMNYNLGLAYSRTGDPDSALLYFEQAEALGALDQRGLFPLANAYYNLGVAYLEADAFEEAVRLFSKVLALDPERQEIHRLLGDIYARSDRVDRALDEFALYLKAYPDDASARDYVYTLHFNRAQQFLEINEKEKAREAFNDALAANPESPLALYYLGYLDYTEGQYEAAADRLTKIYPSSPAEVRENMDSILYNSALSLLEQRKLREALAATEPLTEREPADPKDLCLAGNIHLALKEFEAARICYQRVLTLDPSHRGAIVNMVAARSGAVEELFGEGRSLFRQDRYREALAKLDAALAINPAHPGARAYREETRTEIENKASALLALAEESLRQEKPLAALEDLQTALTLNPESSRGLDLKKQAVDQLSREIGESLSEASQLQEKGALREADAALAHVLELDPDNEEARGERSRIAQLLETRASEIAARGARALEEGKLDEARQDFEAALKLVPDLREGKDGIARIEVLLAGMVSEELQWGRGARSAGHLRQAREHFANALHLRDDPEIRKELEGVDRALAERVSALLDAARQSLDRNDYKRARDYFGQVLAQFPDQTEALEGLGKVKALITQAVEGEIAAAETDLANRDLQKALARYRHALDIDPANGKARHGLDRGLKMMEDELAGLMNAGNKALEKGTFEEARASFKKALALDPYRSDARDGLSRLERLRDSGVKPGDAQQIYLNGIELYTRGKYEEAVEAWKKVLLLSPDHDKARLNIEKAWRKLEQIREYRGG